MKRIAMFVFLWGAGALAGAQEPGHYIGVASCANSGCHGSTHPLQASRVLQNEYYTWLNSDRHSPQAYNVLFSERSARIAKNMRLKKKAYEEAACLDCHSTNVPARLVSGHIDPEDGVQCEACHGPAGGWRAEHAQPGWTHAQSVARGLVDLRDVRIRAHVCGRCHIGGEAREVDHELIASGHPVLAFELDNYSETMPAHWNPNETHGVRAWATGQAMALRDSLANLARHARGEKWPEFSDMNCTNCHHSLKTSGARQERGWPGRAGLPAWSPQHWAVLRTLVARVSPASRTQLDEALAQVASRVSRMNDPTGTAEAAESARKIANDLVPRIDALSWSDADVRAMIDAIAAASYTDVDSAQQAALSLQALATSLARRNPSQLRSPMMKSIDDLFTELQNRDDYDVARFAEKLRAVRQ
jgi:cytochrome c554/c'-like protein